MYEVGDKVWIFTPSSKTGLSQKLMHNWHGPYEIVKKLSTVNYNVKLIGDEWKIQNVHVNRMKRFTDPDDRETNNGDLEVETVGDGEIVKVLDMRSRNDSNRLEKHYFVQFENGETRWIKESDLSDSELVKEFEQSKRQ